MHEENEQAEFTRSERDRLAVKCDLPSVEIGDYIPEFQNIFVFVRTAQYRFNTCQQFNCFKRLCDIIICARAQTAYLVVDVAFCREEYDRDLASAYFFNYFKAVLARKHDVKQYEVIIAFYYHIDCGIAVVAYIAVVIYG